jgi:hypothetical protein
MILEILQHAIENPRVGGSIPSLATIFKQPLMFMSHLGHTGVSHGVYSQTKQSLASSSSQSDLGSTP